MRLANKTVLVTGASKGIGRALALGLAREGAHIGLNYHTDAVAAEAAAREIKAQGRRALCLQADVANVEAVQAMFRQFHAEFGSISVLINNAGVTGWSSLFETSEALWDRILDTNLKGTFFCSLEAARLMRESGGGSIVNVSTNCAALGVKNLTAYSWITT